MNVLITGVAGLLGSRLANWIKKNTEHEWWLRREYPKWGKVL